MKIVIDCDDAAIDLKKTIVEHLTKSGVEVTDLDYLGANTGAFYPEIGYNLALTIQKGEFDLVDVCQGFHGKYLHVFWPYYIMNIEKRKSFC